MSLGDTAGDEELFFDPGENFADFHQIVRLCKEPSLLGDRLLGAVAAMAESMEQISDKGMSCVDQEGGGVTGGPDRP